MQAAGRTFGGELRRRREEFGISQAVLAAQVHVTKPHLSKIEGGTRNPSAKLARLCDAKLHAGGELLALLSPRPRQPEDVPATGSGCFVPWSLHLRPHGESHYSAHDRTTLVGQSTPPVMTHWVMNPGFHENTHAQEALPVFLTLFQEYRRLGQCSGPAGVAPLSIAATGALRGMAHCAPPAQRGSLFQLAARFAEYTGWMAQEASHEPAALWWTHLATDLAAAGGDPEMAAYALVRQAELALYRGDSARTVELSREAGSRTRDLRIKELAAQREAQGHALMGNDGECRRALDHGAELADSARAQPDGTPALGCVHLPDLTAFVSAWCLQELGEPAQAVALLSIGPDAIAPHARRARARHGARLALALADTGDIERACSVAESVAEDVMTTDSATIRSDLKQLRSILNSRWKQQPVVRETLPLITASLRSGPAPLDAGR